MIAKIRQATPLAPAGGVLFVLFALPLIYLPWVRTPFEPPKVFIAEFCIELLVIAAVWHWKKLTISKPTAIAMGLIGLTALWHLISPGTSLVLFGNIYRLQGTVLLFHLMAFSLVAKYLSPKHIPRLLPLISLALLTASAFLIPPNQSHRFIGTLGEPNALAAVAVVLFPFAFFQSSNLFKFISAALTIVLLFLSGSHSGLIAFALELLFMALYFQKMNIYKILAICAVFVALSYALPWFDTGGVFENRLEIWRVGLVAAARHPFIGTGFGSTETAIRATAKTLGSPVQYAYVDSAHNVFIDWFIQSGLIGLSAFIYLIGAALRTHVRKQQIPQVIALVAYLTVASFNPLSVCSLVLVWWGVGEGVSQTS